VAQGIKENLIIFRSEKVEQIAQKVKEQGEAPLMRELSNRLFRIADEFDEEELAAILDKLKGFLGKSEGSVNT
jgi:hypothetical protein